MLLSIAQRVKTLVAIGDDGPQIAESARRHGFRQIREAGSMREAVRQAAAKRGSDVTAVELVGLLPAAELERCSGEFLAWSGLSSELTIEARVGAADQPA